MTARVLTALLAVSVAAGPAAVGQWRPGGRMRIVLLVDSSSAVSSMVNQFRAGLKSFLDALPGDPEIVLVTTGGQIRIRVGPTSDRQKVQAAAGAFAPDGGANAFLDTLLEADRRLLKPAPDFRSVFVILTTDMGTTLGDVRTDTYTRFVEDYVSRGGRAHAVVVQGLNTGFTTRIAENLVQNTGGYYDAVRIANALPRVMKTLADYVAADQ